MISPATERSAALSSRAAPGDDAAPELPHCRNCGTGLLGPWCAECGQRDMPPDPSIRELLAEAWDAFVSVDGKVFSSLRLLLLRPGALTTEYLAGRRVRYLPPLRLYLVCSVAYFLLSSLAPSNEPGPNTAFTVGADTVRISSSASRSAADEARSDSLSRAAMRRAHLPVPAGALDSASRALGDSLRLEQQLDRMSSVPPWLRRRIAHGARRVSHDKSGFGRAYAEQLPKLLFVLMPAFALMLAVVYRSRRRRYPVHLVVALHLHAFVFAVLALDEVRVLLPGGTIRTALKWIVCAWVLAYVPTALRRVYGGRRRWAIARTATLAGVYSLLGAVAVGVMAVVVFLTY